MLTQTVNAQAPQLINFQGQLEGLTTTVASVTFSIYDAPALGTQLWSESYPNLSIVAGRIQVLLGSVTSFPTSVFEGDGSRYLEIIVNGETIMPRTRFTSVSYALRAAVADRLAGGVEAGVTTLNTLAGDVTLVGGDNVSITPEGQSLRIDATGGGSGGITTINAGNGIAVSDSDGPTTEISLAPNGITDAYVADNSLTGSSIASNAIGSDELESNIVLGPDGRLEVENAGGQSRTVLATTSSAGFIGINSADNQDAVTIDTQSGDYGRLTVHNSTGLNGVRLWGNLNGPDSDTGVELRGGSVATFKRNGSNSSVWIRTNGTSDGNSWGVITVDNGSNNASITLDGQNGDISISGNLSKGSGTFKIDHPLDPQNKYLSHSFVESPDMMNVYNGNTVLDVNGEAWVELPEWFEALNKDFRYQLTCIGGFAQVYIAEEISDNRFKIAGGLPELKVSWMVTGVRQDPYANAHRVQVEEEKPPQLKGTYLHPEAYSTAAN